MQTFNTKAEALAAIRALPGYLLATLEDERITSEETVGSTRTVVSRWSYRQEVQGNGHKVREALVFEDFAADGTPGVVRLSLALVSETPEGANKTVASYSGPDQYYPWVFSMREHASRDTGDTSDKFRADGSAAQQGDADAILFYKTTMRKVIPWADFNFQNTLACWDRLNEGDFFNFYVDIPGAYVGQPGLPWSMAMQFGAEVALFGQNHKGTYYPPNVSPSMSPLPPGASIRVEFMKCVINDPWHVLLAGETYDTMPGALKRGAFINLDLLGQRIR